MDEDPFLYQYIILFILLLLSFYFSGSETAIFSLSRLERNALKKTKSKKLQGILIYLLEHQEQLLITILTGNMVVNIFVSSIGSVIGEDLFKGKSEIISILGITLLLLLVGELTPKRIAVSHSQGFTRIAAIPLYYLHLFLSPVRYILNHISLWILNIFPQNMGGENDEKHTLVLSTAEFGYNQEILKQAEYQLFKSYLAFKDKNARDVMTPRSELRTISHDLSIGDVIELIASDQEYVVNSSIILFKEDNDHLYGWIPLTKILECKFRNINLNERISTLSREFHTVPESKNLPTLILELRETDMDIVLLVDEYGGTAGIVWFRNIIEDVLRAFYAPSKDKPGIYLENNNLISGSMPIEELEEFAGINIDVDVKTAAGFFLNIFDNIPVPGDKIIYHQVNLKVLNMEGNKIRTLQIEMEPEL
jgi:magnesium and cobalt exporter, CNNM family